MDTAERLCEPPGEGDNQGKAQLTPGRLHAMFGQSRALSVTGEAVLLAKKYGIITEKMVIMATYHLFTDVEASYAINFP
ncbi:MAG: hypothetical protein R3E79_58925 [Caldilineaceae bacterium]